MNLDLIDINVFEAIPGHGIRAQVDHKELYVGNERLLTKHVNENPFANQAEAFAQDGKTLMYVIVDKALVGIIAVADVIKDTSRLAIAKMHEQGLEVAMITGDHVKTAEAIAKLAGIDRVIADVLPEDKANEVKKLQSQGKKSGHGWRRYQRCTSFSPSRRWNSHWVWNRCSYGICRHRINEK